jgi:hypothetical protein
MTENGWGKERKIKGKIAMSILVAGGEGGAEARPWANGRLFKLYFIHATSPCTLVLNIHVIRVVSIPTLCICISHEISFQISKTKIEHTEKIKFILN